jgi:SAM-dependent methyltransferase
MTATFKDHFSGVAKVYAEARPRYQADLFAWLAGQCRGHDLAWDCATGSGQAATHLANHFAHVAATDASAAQIAAAEANPRIAYSVAPAEASGLETASADLVTVAQALHWFDIERFYAEARRVLKPGGVIAVWCYGVFRAADPAVDRAAQRFYSETVGPYWPPERVIVESGYATLPFPFEPIEAPRFEMITNWTLAELAGYWRSWSATARYQAATGLDPVTPLEAELEALWGDPAAPMRIDWPLSLRVGRA